MFKNKLFILLCSDVPDKVRVSVQHSLTPGLLSTQHSLMNLFNLFEFCFCLALVEILCRTGNALRPRFPPTLKKILYGGSGWVSGVLLCLPEKYIWSVNFVLTSTFSFHNFPTLFMDPTSDNTFLFNVISFGLFLVWLCDLPPVIYSTILNYFILCRDTYPISLMLLLVSTSNDKIHWWLSSSIVCYIVSTFFSLDQSQALLLTLFNSLIYSQLKVKPFKWEIKLFGKTFEFEYTE